VRVRANVPSSLKVSCNCLNMRLSYINSDIMAGSAKGIHRQVEHTVVNTQMYMDAVIIFL
jgi:hypothetical protein